MFTTSGDFIGYDYQLVFVLLTVRLVFEFYAQLPVVAMNMISRVGRLIK